MIYFVTYLICCILNSLFLCNSVFVTDSIKSSNFSVISNVKWSDKLISTMYKRIINPAANNGREKFSSEKLLKKVPPGNSNWNIKDDLKSAINYGVATYTSTNMSSQLPVNLSKEWSRFVASYGIKMLTTNKDHQRTMEDKDHQCTVFQDCQRYLMDSQCMYQNGRRVCRCLKDDIEHDNKCLPKVTNGKICQISRQCIEKPNRCHLGYCNCPDSYMLHKESCIYEPKEDDTLFSHLLIIIIAVIAGILVFIIFMYFIYRQMKVGRSQEPTLSERRQRTVSEICNESVDKPPSYDEAITMPLTTPSTTIEGSSQISSSNHAVAAE